MSAVDDAEAVGFRIGHGNDCVFVQAVTGSGVMTGEQAIRLGVAIIRQGVFAQETARMAAETEVGDPTA